MNLVCALLLLFNPVSHPDDTVSRLRPWPEAGPPVVFSVNGIGNGYSSPAVTDNRIFITGEKDKTGYLYSFDLLGKPLTVSIQPSGVIIEESGVRLELVTA